MICLKVHTCPVQGDYNKWHFQSHIHRAFIKCFQCSFNWNSLIYASQVCSTFNNGCLATSDKIRLFFFRRIKSLYFQCIDTKQSRLSFVLNDSNSMCVTSNAVESRHRLLELWRFSVDEIINLRKSTTVQRLYLFVYVVRVFARFREAVSELSL